MADRSRSLWLLPTTPLFEARLARRYSADGPKRLDRLLRRQIQDEAKVHDVPVVTVDGSLGIDELTMTVSDHFRAALAVGPRAATGDERRVLLREMNESVVHQIRGYYARPWAEGNPDLVRRTFVCECGQPECEADAVATVAETAATPVFAAGHS
jgi:hypothetical protein